jgi:hypothetical protein
MRFPTLKGIEAYGQGQAIKQCSTRGHRQEQEATLEHNQTGNRHTYTQRCVKIYRSLFWHDLRLTTDTNTSMYTHCLLSRNRHGLNQTVPRRLCLAYLVMIIVRDYVLRYVPHGNPLANISGHAAMF